MKNKKILILTTILCTVCAYTEAMQIPNNTSTMSREIQKASQEYTNTAQRIMYIMKKNENIMYIQDILDEEVQSIKDLILADKNIAAYIEQKKRDKILSLLKTNGTVDAIATIWHTIPEIQVSDVLIPIAEYKRSDLLETLFPLFDAHIFNNCSRMLWKNKDHFAWLIIEIIKKMNERPILEKKLAFPFGSKGWFQEQNRFLMKEQGYKHSPSHIFLTTVEKYYMYTYCLSNLYKPNYQQQKKYFTTYDQMNRNRNQDPQTQALRTHILNNSYREYALQFITAWWQKAHTSTRAIILECAQLLKHDDIMHMVHEKFKMQKMPSLYNINITFE